MDLLDRAGLEEYTVTSFSDLHGDKWDAASDEIDGVADEIDFGIVGTNAERFVNQHKRVFEEALST